MHPSSAYCLKAHSDKEKWLNWNIMQRIGIASKALKQISPVIMHMNFNTKHNVVLKATSANFKLKKFILLKKNFNFSALIIIQNDEAKQYY